MYEEFVPFHCWAPFPCINMPYFIHSPLMVAWVVISSDWQIYIEFLTFPQLYWDIIKVYSPAYIWSAHLLSLLNGWMNGWMEGWDGGREGWMDRWMNGRQTGRSLTWHSFLLLFWMWASLMAQTVRNPPAMQAIGVQSLSQEDCLEKGMATHSSILAWRIPWIVEPDALQSMGSQRVRHD